jgi:hypothetical protein
VERSFMKGMKLQYCKLSIRSLRDDLLKGDGHVSLAMTIAAPIRVSFLQR